MTNRIAFFLILGLAALAALDIATGAGIGVFLGRKFLDLLDWMAFWR